jgi:hypothetical protein
MKRTSPSSRLVSSAARSPALAITGPDVAAEIDAHFPRHDLRQRRLAQARGAEKQHMVKRLAARLCGGNEHAIRRFSRAAAWPTNSPRVLGRRAASTSSGVRAGHRWSGRSLRRLFQRQPHQRVERGGCAQFLAGGIDRAARLGGLEAKAVSAASASAWMPVAGGCAASDRMPAKPALSFSSWQMRWASLGPTPLARAIIAASPLAMARCTSTGSSAERIASATLPPTPARCEQAEPVAFIGAGKADQAKEILPHQHFGVHRHMIADDTDGRQGARRCLNQIADAIDVDHGMACAPAIQPSGEFGDHRVPVTTSGLPQNPFVPSLSRHGFSPSVPVTARTVLRQAQDERG